MAILDPSLWYTPCWCVLLVITSFVWATSSDPPSDPRNIATHSATKDHHGGIPMGVVAGCDDAESNIEVDWNLRSTMEYTCEGNILKPEEIKISKMYETETVQNGAIVAMYHPCADPGEVERLRGMVRGCLRRHVITPYPHLPPPHPLRPVVLGMQATDEPRSDLCRAQLNSGLFPQKQPDTKATPQQASDDETAMKNADYRHSKGDTSRQKSKSKETASLQDPVNSIIKQSNLRRHQLDEKTDNTQRSIRRLAKAYNVFKKAMKP